MSETPPAPSEHTGAVDSEAVIGETLAAVFRDEAGKLTASLVRQIGDFDLAEELVQDALLSALEHWPQEGIPRRPGAWLMAVARRKAVDRWRREQRYKEKVALLDYSPVPEPAEVDDRLRLIFTCCHPALAREAQLALTLRAVVGLTTAEIARAFLTSETTIAQRIVRAKWLASLLDCLMPDQPEALGLLALMRLHLARARARFAADGRVVLLRDQDRRLWDRAAIEGACGLVERALRDGKPGPYQVQAAITACHGEASSWEETDWRQILLLYDLLLAMTGSPVVRLNRSIALCYVRGPSRALAELDALEGSLHGYHLYHATRAEVLHDLGRVQEAQEAIESALTFMANPAERALLLERLSSSCSPKDSGSFSSAPALS